MVGENVLRSIFHQYLLSGKRRSFNKLILLIMDFHNIFTPRQVTSVTHNSRLRVDAKITSRGGRTRVSLGGVAFVNYYGFLETLKNVIFEVKPRATFVPIVVRRQVVLVTGPKKPTGLWDSAEQRAHKRHMKKVAKRYYRYIQVANYTEFVRDVHKRTTAKECVNRLWVDGHGWAQDTPSDRYAQHYIGSIDNGGVWGETKIGIQGNTEHGLDVFRNIRFCRPCEIIIGGCNFASAKVGLKFLQMIANVYGCTAVAFTARTIRAPLSSRAAFYSLKGRRVTKTRRKIVIINRGRRVEY